MTRLPLLILLSLASVTDAALLTYLINQSPAAPTTTFTLFATGHAIDGGTLGTFPASWDLPSINGLHSTAFINVPGTPAAYGAFGLDTDPATGVTGFAAAFTNERAAEITSGHLNALDVFGADYWSITGAVSLHQYDALYGLWMETRGMQLAYGNGFSVGGQLVHFADYSLTPFVSVMDVPEPGVAWLLLGLLVRRTTRRGRRRAVERARFPPAEVGWEGGTQVPDHV